MDDGYWDIYREQSRKSELSPRNSIGEEKTLCAIGFANDREFTRAAMKTRPSRRSGIAPL